MLYTNDMYQTADLPTKLYMQTQEWLWEYDRTDNEFIKNSLMERLQSNYEMLKKIGFQDDLMNDLEERIEEINGLR